MYNVCLAWPSYSKDLLSLTLVGAVGAIELCEDLVLTEGAKRDENTGSFYQEPSALAIELFAYVNRHFYMMAFIRPMINIKSS